MTAEADTMAPAPRAEMHEGDGDPRPLLSAYIRTLNEERMVDAVVRGALKVAREVIVVDSGSTDGTCEIAEAAGARVVDQPWIGTGRQKRIGETAAQHDWLLDLDADEVVTDDLAAEIAAVLNANPPANTVLRLKLVTVPPFGKPFYGVKIAYRNRVYNRTAIRVPDSQAWDQLDLPGGTPLRTMDAPLMHHAFSSIGHVVAKQNRNTDARAEAALKPLPVIVLRVFFAMPVYFFKEYVFKKLALRGVYGFSYALTVAFGRWLRDVKMFEIHMRQRGG
ncbi:glycosyltransferase family 2 protein [Acuticoccus sp. MNP-M23]|uniref:glycosyltransferase family 2 protein n=1 Tax=Acuticoccus sp. MNP-M23 TaxID=3072793 RepID=UPI002815CE82|nr:glycosyltransferase family 2 protein [Acuticoccus sp. MNP-M23]WMS42331.1 glycosyltransferase family 2 protein [Acuticoccus sp. MNP-M23]